MLPTPLPDLLLSNGSPNPAFKWVGLSFGTGCFAIQGGPIYLEVRDDLAPFMVEQDACIMNEVPLTGGRAVQQRWENETLVCGRGHFDRVLRAYASTGPTPEWATVAQAAAHFNVSTDTVRSWLATRIRDAVSQHGRVIRIHMPEAKALLMLTAPTVPPPTVPLAPLAPRSPATRRQEADERIARLRAISGGG